MVTEDSEEEYSQLSQLIRILGGAFSDLKLKISGHSIEKIAVLIYECMSTRTRLYHRVEHCLAVPQNVDAIGVLAYLFHDVVYWQVDRARHEMLRQYMLPCTPTENGAIEIPKNITAKNANLSEASVITRFVFGLQRAQSLDFTKGMNEFLSACVVENLLKGTLTHWQIVEVAACIEATIPFRRVEDGQTAMDRLHARLSEMNKALKLGKSESEIKKCVVRAINVANHDVSNFAFEQTGIFLKNTWDLTWENNPMLQRETYTIKQYRSALQKNAAFYRVIDPSLVFSSMKGYPDEALFERLVTKAHKNVTVGLEYIRAKVVSAAIIEAIADCTGGDAPVILFMGTHPNYGLSETWKTLIENLPILRDSDGLRGEVYRLLSSGRDEQKHRFDVSRSPVATYVYANLDKDSFAKAVELTEAYLAGKLKPVAFLKMDPILSLVPPIFERLRTLAVSRTDAFEELASEIIKKKKAAA